MALEQLCHMLIVFVNQWGMTNATCVENSILPILELLLAITQNSIVSNEIYRHLSLSSCSLQISPYSCSA